VERARLGSHLLRSLAAYPAAAVVDLVAVEHRSLRIRFARDLGVVCAGDHAPGWQAEGFRSQAWRVEVSRRWVLKSPGRRVGATWSRDAARGLDKGRLRRECRIQVKQSDALHRAMDKDSVCDA
jgi:hypothetical protein